MGEVQLAQIREEIKGTTSNNAYPRFSCNYSFLAANSFYIIPAKPQETSSNSCQYASIPADATGDPVNRSDPSGLTCQDVQQAVVQADNLHIQMDQASIDALNRTCSHSRSLNTLLVQGNESSTGGQSHSFIHQLYTHYEATMNVIGNTYHAFKNYDQCAMGPNATLSNDLNCFNKDLNPVYAGFVSTYGCVSDIGGSSSLGQTAVDCNNALVTDDSIVLAAGGCLSGGAEGASTAPRVVIGGMEDLGPGAIGPGEETLASRLPADTGDRLGNWLNNRDVLLQAMDEGNPIRDASVDSEGNLSLEDTRRFITMERDYLRSAGWTYNPSTTMWMPAGT